MILMMNKMKRRILQTIVALLAIVSSATAQTLSVASIEAQTGEQAELVVSASGMSNVTALQFNLALPQGVTLNENAITKGSAVSSHELKVETLANGDRLFVLYNMDLGLVNNGTLLKLPITVGQQTGSFSGNLSTIRTATTDAVSHECANATFNITASPAKVILDENSTTAPETSVGAVNVTVNRTIKANEWSTICLPFNMTAAQVASAFGNDVLLKRLSSWSFTGSTNAAEGITMGFTTATIIEKNYPCLIKVTSNISSFDVDGVEIAPEDAPSSPGVEYSVGNKKYYASLNGTYIKKTTDATDMFLANNKFWYSDGSTVIKGFRAVFNFGDVVLNSYNGDGSARVTMILDDEGTGIGNVVYQMIGETYYNLNGQRVITPDKGLYIHNGKKVIVK